MRFKLKKIQRSYISCDWTVMQNLNKFDLVVSKMAWGIGWTFITALKSLKNCTLMDSFCPKDIMFQLENFKGIMCHDTEDWCKIWRKTDLWLEKWLIEFGWFSCEQAKICTLMGFFCPKHITRFRWKSTEKFCLVTLKSVQCFKKNWLLVPKMTWWIWWILMWAEASLKVCTLMCYFSQ